VTADTLPPSAILLCTPLLSSCAPLCYPPVHPSAIFLCTPLLSSCAPLCYPPVHPSAIFLCTPLLSPSVPLCYLPVHPSAILLCTPLLSSCANTSCVFALDDLALESKEEPSSVVCTLAVRAILHLTRHSSQDPTHLSPLPRPFRSVTTLSSWTPRCSRTSQRR
jgi:hypothetical protein